MNTAVAPSYARDTLIKAVKLHFTGCIYRCGADKALVLQVRRSNNQRVTMNSP